MSLKSCYGVDRQGDHMVAVLAQRSGSRVTCTPVNSDRGTSLPADSVPSVTALPSGRCLTRWIETPFTSAAKTRSVLPALLDVQLPFPLESCHYSCVSLEIGPTSSRALTAAVRQTDLDAELKVFSTFNINPLLVDCEPLALWTQAMLELPAPGPHLTRAILYLGTDSFRMAVGRESAYLGGHSTRPDDLSQLVRFLKLYEKPDLKPADVEVGTVEWWLCGPGADNPTQVDSLRTALAAASGGTVGVLQDPIRFLARAIATRALLAGPLRCNLRIGSATHPTLLTSGRRSTMTNAYLILASGLLLISANIASSLYLNHKTLLMDQQFRNLAESLTGTPLTGQKGEQALQFVKNTLQRRQSEMAPFITRAKPSTAEILAPLLSSARDHHIQLERVSIDSGSVTIDGACASMSDCTALADTVRRLGCPVLVHEASVLPDGRKGFSIVPGTPST
jgi:hypothetical protein